MKLKDNIVRPLGAGLAMTIPIILSLLLKDMQIATLGVMGAFSYLHFQYHSIAYNIKAIFLHGGLLVISLFFGMVSSIHPWSIPFIICLITFLGKIITGIYRIPKPNDFFIMMLYATGTNFNIASINQALFQSHYLLYGLMGSIISGVLISLIERLPYKLVEDTTTSKLSFTQKYQQMVKSDPYILIKSLHFSLIIFIAAYVSILFKETNGYWILVSSAAILSGGQTDKIKQRSFQRIIGSIIGLLIGLILLSFNLPTGIILIILVILNILIEVFMPINYTIANFFTNPQVILLATLATPIVKLSIISERFIGIIIGTAIAYFFILLIEYAMNLIVDDHN